MKRAPFFALTVAVTVALAMASSALRAQPVVTIELLGQAHVDAPAVVLGQVARVASTDLALLRQLVALPVGTASSSGLPQWLQRERLQPWVQRRTGLSAGQVRWSGTSSSRVAMRTQTVDGPALAEAALRAVEKSHAARRPALERTPPDTQVPVGPLRLEVRPLPQVGEGGRALAWVELWQDDRFLRAVPVAFRMDPVEAARPDRPAAPRAAPVVVRGEWAWLRSGLGAVTTEARVEILQDGRPGERIRVRPAGGAGSLLASVVAPGRLEVAR